MVDIAPSPFLSAPSANLIIAAMSGAFLSVLLRAERGKVGGKKQALLFKDDMQCFKYISYMGFVTVIEGETSTIGSILKDDTMHAVL